MINQIGDMLVKASDVLVEFIHCSDQSKRTELYRCIKSYESECDTLVDNIYNELNNSFITPFDREDIHELCEALDDTLDGINSSSKRVLLFQPKQIPSKMEAMCRVISNACHAASIAVKELKTINKKPDIALQQCTILHDLEQEGDELYEEFVKDIFEYEKDTIELVKNKEIMQELEGTTDFAKIIGKTIKTIIVKYA